MQCVEPLERRRPTAFWPKTMKIEIELPERHYEILKRIAGETETTMGCVVAQGIAVLQCLYDGIWRVEENYDPFLPRKELSILSSSSD